MATLEEQLKELTGRVLKLEGHLGMAPLREALADFKGLMETLDMRTLEFIFQGESDESLACVLMGQDKGVIENVKGALSKKRWERIYSEMKKLFMEGVTKDHIDFWQKTLLLKVQKLEDMGEIVVASYGEGVGSGRPWPWNKEVSKLDLRDWATKVLDSFGEKL